MIFRDFKGLLTSSGEFMSRDNTLNFYEEVKEDLKFFGISSIRVKIMIILMDGPKKTSQLRKLTGIQSSTILRGINGLEKQRIVSRDIDNYYLSEIGHILSLKLEDMIKTLIVLKKCQNLWLNHEINDIPKKLLMNIGNLSDSEFIESEKTNIFKAHGLFIDILLQSKTIKGVSTIFHPDFTKTFLQILDNKEVKVELILSEAVLKQTIKNLNPLNLKDFIKLNSSGSINLWILNEEVKVAFTVTDKHLSLGLYTKEGVYDASRGLISKNNDAILWANDLFEYYRQKSDKIGLKKLDKLISHLI
jgi:predicted transcriptional regulator